jgi:hypothetical protein
MKESPLISVHPHPPHEPWTATGHPQAASGGAHETAPQTGGQALSDTQTTQVLGLTAVLKRAVNRVRGARMQAFRLQSLVRRAPVSNGSLPKAGRMSDPSQTLSVMELDCQTQARTHLPPLSATTPHRTGTRAT